MKTACIASLALTLALAANAIAQTTVVPVASTVAVSYPEGVSEGRAGGLYGSAEGLLWWLKRDHGKLPPLATSGNPADTPTGALGQPGTKLLFGGNAGGGDDPNPYAGGRFTLGLWFGEPECGLEVTYLFLQERQNTLFAAGNNGGPGSGSLNLPFYNNDGLFEDAFNVGLEGVQAGAISIRQSQYLSGFECNLRRPLAVAGCWEFTALAGYRHLNLKESIDIETASTALPANLGIQTFLSETHGTQNSFHGGQIGGQVDFFHKCLRLTLVGKLALGANDMIIERSGITTNIDPINGLVVAPGGIYVGPNNQGGHHRRPFAVLPEVNLNLGYLLNDCVTLTAGYSFLYLSDSVRPEDQFDRVVNFQVNDRPHPQFQVTDFWVQGFNLGILVRY